MNTTAFLQSPGSGQARARAASEARASEPASGPHALPAAELGAPPSESVHGKRVGILIVAYNAVTTLAGVLRRIPPRVWSEVEEVVVCDDASKDDTYELAVGYKTLTGIDKLTVLPLPLVTNETIKYCQEGTWQEMADGCNAFPPSLVSNPGWFASIYSPETPEVGLQAALVGQPEE